MQINPQMMKKLMKQIKAEEIDAEEVIIKTNKSNIIITNPQVVKTNMGGVESFQISGDIREETKFDEEDIQIIREKTGCTKEEAIESIQKADGDLAKAIMSFSE